MVLPLDWEPSAEDPFTFQGDCCSSREGGRTRDELDDTLFATFAPPSRKDRTFSALLQDKLDLWDEKLFLTLGSKFEHNDCTGFDYQPNARLTWLACEQQTLWAAVSRAVRIMSSSARLAAKPRCAGPVALPDR